MTSSRQQAAAATVTTPATARSTIERVFDAPRDRVFAVYTDPELIPEWWGPRDTTDDRRRDGRPDRRELALRRAQARTAARPPSAAPTARSPRPSGSCRPSSGRACPATCRSRPPTFEDLGDRTKVTTTSLFHTTEERDGMLASGMEGGLNETYARLDELLERLG